MKTVPSIIVCAALAWLLSGCAANPGHLSKTTSTFDGTKSVRMTPAWVSNGFLKTGSFKLGAHFNTKMTNYLMLDAYSTDAIGDGKSLAFNFNGEIVTLAAAKGTWDVESDPYTHEVWHTQRFRVADDFAQRLVTATNVTVRMELRRSYVEGKISTDAPTTFRPSFRKFLREKDALSGALTPASGVR